MKPRAIDLFAGLGGWTEGLLAEGFDVTGYDIEAHEYDGERYPARLVLQDVLTLHGSEFADATLIVASPPCQEYSYMAMPWTRAKAKAAAIRADSTGAALERLNALFNACFRIQREASEAAGRRIPLVVENVRGAQPWVGRAAWNFGSYYLWGDVPALMPQTLRAVKVPGMDWNGHPAGSKPVKPDYKAVAFNDEAVRQMQGTKNTGGSWFNIAHNTTSGVGNNPDGRKNPGFRFDGSGRSFQSESVNRHVEGMKGEGGSWFGEYKPGQNMQRNTHSKSPARKAASAKIAKIPFALSSWIARAWRETVEQPSLAKIGADDGSA